MVFCAPLLRRLCAVAGARGGCGEVCSTAADTLTAGRRCRRTVGTGVAIRGEVLPAEIRLRLDLALTK